MAKKNKLQGVTNIEDIHIDIPNCPGCNREHEITIKRPVTTKNCSRGMGTFVATVTSGGGQLTVSVTFQDNSYNTKDCTSEVIITVTS